MLPYGQPVANGSAPTAQVPGQMQEHLQINAYGNDAHIYNMDDFSLVRRIEVGPNPHGISATADGRTVESIGPLVLGERAVLTDHPAAGETIDTSQGRNVLHGSGRPTAPPIPPSIVATFCPRSFLWNV